MSDETLEAQTSGNDAALSNLWRVLANYKGNIIIAVTVVAAALVLGAGAVYVIAPSDYTSAMAFRLEFPGAEDGQYPNGTKFSAAEITATPVLATVYERNDLQRFCTFDEFKSSVFVVQSNEELESLTRAYNSRLADPKLTAVDRERIEQEFREKRATLSKSDYSITLVRREGLRRIPEVLRTKVLNDVLSTWAYQTIRDKGVALYDVSILSKRVFEDTNPATADYIIVLDLIRTRVEAAIENIDTLLDIPGAKVVRTSNAGMSLAELRLQLDDMLSYKVRPLIGMVAAEAIAKTPATSLEFLRAQLRHKELSIQQARERMGVVRAAIDAYSAPTLESSPSSGAPSTSGSLIPQIDESFLDRIVELTGEAADVQYRQKLTDEFQKQASAVVPLDAEARYYRTLLDSYSQSPSRPAPAEAASIEQQITAIIRQAVRALEDVNDIYNTLSKDLNPSTMLYTVTQPAVHSVLRSISGSTLVLWTLLAFALCLAMIFLATIIHARWIAATRDRDVAVDHTDHHGEVTAQPSTTEVTTMRSRSV